MKPAPDTAIATTADVTVEAKAESGLVKGLKRSVLGGESMFMRNLAGGEGGFLIRAEGAAVRRSWQEPSDLVGTWARCTRTRRRPTRSSYGGCCAPSNPLISANARHVIRQIL